MSNKTEILNKYLSKPRLRPYFRACGNNLDKGLELYQLNMRLGASFLPLLSLLEVSLRNAIDKHLCSFFGKEEWWDEFAEFIKNKSEEKIDSLEKKYGIVCPNDYKNGEPLLKIANSLKNHRKSEEKRLKANIRNSVKIYLRKFKWFKGKNEFEQLTHITEECDKKLADTPISAKTASHSHLISSTTFGFWTTMFKKDIFVATNGSLLSIFPNKTITTNFKKVSNMLDEIRSFRNRVAHHDPLCFDKGDFSLKRAKIVNQHIKEILLMLDEDLESFSKETYMIHQNILDVNNFIDELPKIVGFEESFDS
jgi:hypothetical protein